MAGYYLRNLSVSSRVTDTALFRLTTARPDDTSKDDSEPARDRELALSEMNPAIRLGRLAVALVAISLVFFVATASLGPSAAQPTIPGTGPSRQLGVDPADWIVTVLMWSALVSATVAVALGWLALRRGWAPDPHRLRRWGFGGAAVMALLPPLGSTDIMSYGAYGRMVVLGLNPYTTTVNDLAAMGDPIGVTYQGDWPDVASVYGPVALGVQGLTSWFSGSSMRWFVLGMQLIALAAFMATTWLLDRAAGNDAARLRVAWLWAANPLLFYLVVNSAHIDGIAVAIGVAALLVVGRSPVAAGVLVALAVGTKISYVLYAAALIWALRATRSGLTRLVVASLLTGCVLFIPFLPGMLDPLQTASEYVARQSVWSLIRDTLREVLSHDTVAMLLWIAVWTLIVLVVWRLSRVLPHRSDGPATRDEALRTAALLGVGWLLSTTYALPWYDVIAWAPLVLLPASGVDAILLLRTASVAIGYLPGTRPPGTVGSITMTLAGTVTPLVGLALLVTVLFFGDRLRLPGQGPPQPRAPYPLRAYGEPEPDRGPTVGV